MEFKYVVFWKCGADWIPNSVWDDKDSATAQVNLLETRDDFATKLTHVPYLPKEVETVPLMEKMHE